MSLENVQEGDQVISCRGDIRSIVAVKKVTKTQICIVTSNERYRRSDGRIVGAGIWDSWQIMAIESEEQRQEVLQEMRRRYLLKKIEAVDWETVENGVIARILELVKETKSE